MNCSKKSETKGSVTRKIFCVVVILGLAAAAGLSFYSCDQLWPPDEGPGDTNENPPGDDVTPAPGQESPGPTGESSSVPTGGATDVSTPAPTDIATPVPDSVFYFEGDTLVIVSPDGIQLRFRAENGWTYNAGESRYEAYGIVYLGTPFGEIEMEVEILIAAPDPLYIGATVVEFPFPKFRFLLDSDFQMPVTTLAIASGSELNADDIGIPLMDDRLYLLFTYENGEDFEFSFLDVSVSRENGDAYQGTIIFDVADPMFYVEGDVYGLSCLENKGVEDIGIGISTQALIPVASSYELYNGTSWKTYTVDSHLYGKGTIPFNIKGIPFECEGNVGINADANGDGTFLGFSDDTGFLDDIAFCTNALLRISPEKYGFTFSLDIGAGSAVYDNDEGKLMFHGRSLKNRLFELIEPVQHHDFQIYGYYDVDTDDLYFKAEGSVFNLIQGYELRNATLEFYNGKVTLSGDLRFGENFVHVSGSVSSNGDCELKGTGRWNFFGYELGNATVVFSKRGEAVSFQGEGMVDVGPLDVRVNGSIGPDGSYLLSYRDELILAGYTLRNVEVNFSGNITSAQLALDVTVRIGDAYVRFSGNVATDGTFGFRNTNSFKVGGYSLS
ncbi:MAG: hypothetical protein JW881_06770, partial [Spirochaetales bacterium]|nr:hypothetical protein [Spirochaetales bacterium]